MVKRFFSLLLVILLLLACGLSQGVAPAGTFPSPLPAPTQQTPDKSLTITIYDNQQQLLLSTTKQVVGDLLVEAGITLSEGDTVHPPLDTPLTNHLVIIVTRLVPYTILVDGQVIQWRSQQNSPQTILAEAGIALFGLDFTRPELTTTLRPGDTIQVIRVNETFRTQDTPIPFETIWQPDEQTEIDQQSLIQSGTAGILRQRLRVRLENGQEVSQVVDGEWVALPPVDQIFGYGTKIILRTLQTSNGTYQYWRLVKMRVTSYTAASSGKPPDHPAYGITASGLYAGTGIAAIDKTIVPFRTWLYVPGYGLAFAGDTGGGVIGRWIDLGYHEEDYVPWAGYVDVYYLTPVPNEINYLIPTTLP